MAADELMPSHRSHRTPKSGPTARKKSELDKKKRGISVDKQKNLKVGYSYLSSLCQCLLRVSSLIGVFIGTIDFTWFCRRLVLNRLFMRRKQNITLRRRSKSGFIFRKLIVIMAKLLLSSSWFKAPQQYCLWDWCCIFTLGFAYFLTSFDCSCRLESLSWLNLLWRSSQNRMYPRFEDLLPLYKVLCCICLLLLLLFVFCVCIYLEF